MGQNEYLMRQNYYDDMRGDAYIQTVSIPSKYLENGYLEIFIRYDPEYNPVMDYRCPDSKALDGRIEFSDGFKAGMEASMDTTKSVDDFLPSLDDKIDQVKQAAQCLSELFIIKIDDQTLSTPEFSFYQHPSKDEKGFLVIADVSQLPRGKHTLEIDYLKFTGIFFMQDVTEDKLEFKPLARLPFWTH